MLALTGLEDFQSLEPDAWGIPGFPKDVAGRRDCFEAEEGEGLEVMAVPGVAFDADFNRLGHGRGFYDLFLSRYCGRRRKPVLVALALEEQWLERGMVPAGEGDWKVDVVVTGGGKVFRRDVGDGGEKSVWVEEKAKEAGLVPDVGDGGKA